MRGAAPSIIETLTAGLISTHAPHARRGEEQAELIQALNISTHAPHARRGSRGLLPGGLLFDFYSRASCEARRYRKAGLSMETYFYSRASCEARLPVRRVLYTNQRKFLLTRLMRGAANWVPVIERLR